MTSRYACPSEQRPELLRAEPHRDDPAALVTEAEDHLAGGAVAAHGDDALQVDQGAGLALGLRLSSRHGGTSEG
jgi:hypothetical protein